MFLSSFIFTPLLADDITKIARDLNLYAGTKAIVQWERIFSSDRRMKKHNIDTLSNGQIYRLKSYLIKHAADSDQPIVPGL